MRILNLRFKNLNSLAGEWVIDFTDPAFVTDGIFAITGPTGAGKTTILDAVCLALYGATPRLDKVTASSNDIMSIGTGECSSELTFETPSGRYRCTWSQHRARRDARGGLQTPRHELVDADTDKILASALTTVGEKVEEITGLNFKRFTRSILLAQGAFAVFLQSTSNERAPILEQITRTEIYSRLSMKVHERERLERSRLEELELRIQGLALLSPEAETEARAELAKLELELTALGDSLEALRKQIQWREGIERLQKRLVELGNEQQQFEAELAAFQPQRQRLERAVVAAELDGPAAKLELLRKTLGETRQKLQQLDAELPKSQQACRERELQYSAAEAALSTARADLASFEPEKQAMEELDRRIQAKREALREVERRREELKGKGEADRATLAELEKRLAGIEQALEDLGQFFKANSADGWLLTGLSGLKVKLDNLQGALAEMTHKASEVKSSGEVIASLNRELEKVEKGEAKAQAKLVELDRQIKQCELDSEALLAGRTLAVVQAELDQRRVEKERANLVASLEEHRARLHPGEECPLCGSLEHPFKQGEPPVASELDEAISQLSQLVSRVNRLEEEGKKLWLKRCEAEKIVADEKEKVARQRASIEREQLGLQSASDLLEKAREQSAQLERAILEEIRPLGIERLPESGLGGFHDSLVERRTRWERETERKQELERARGMAREEFGRVESRVAGLQEQLEELANVQQQKDLELVEELRVRHDRFGLRDPVEEGKKLDGLVKAALELERVELEKLNQAKQSLAGLSAQQSGWRNELRQREQEILPAESELQQQLSVRGFNNEREFQEARITAEQRRELAQQDEVLKKRGLTLGKELADLQQRLSEEQAKQMTGDSLELLNGAVREKQAAMDEKNQNKGAKEQILKENEERKQQAASHQQELSRQQIECRRWAQLHELIGSSDGKKFRNFAQGVTFERLIAHANQQLAKMSDRYELVASKSDPLDLSVRDHDQGGDVRTTKNLSGGESFLVSLALALGLSQMASGRVRVDSLFLDEGFGTLDEGTLETALSTLADLRQSGKLIGLISHVSALNERINTKIEVSKIGEGRSRLRGPGIAKIAGG